MKKIALALATLLTVTVLAACTTDADVASENLSKDADNFKILRRIVFYNGITEGYVLELTGYCSIEVDGEDEQLEVTCKVGDDKYIKDFLGLSDNVTYFVEQLEGVDVSTDYYKVVFKPSTIVPDIEIR